MSVLVRVNVVQEVPQAQQPVAGIVGRMKGMVSSAVMKYGNTLKDSVQRRTLISGVTANTS